jgi:hypothetical protein
LDDLKGLQLELEDVDEAELNVVLIAAAVDEEVPIPILRFRSLIG